MKNTTIEMTLPLDLPVTELDDMVAQVGWTILSENPDRIIVAPARDVLQFPADTPVAVGIFPDRIEFHQPNLVESCYTGTRTLLAQLAAWLQLQQMMPISG